MKLNWTNWRHGVYTLGIQLSLGWFVGFWNAGAMACFLFFGREHAQEQAKLAATLRVSVKELPPLSCLDVTEWHPDSKRDFWVPVGTAIAVGAVSSLVLWLIKKEW